MLKITKQDELVATFIDTNGLWEILLTTTFKKENEAGEKKHTYSVKTFDNDVERAIIILNNSVAKYFAEKGFSMFDEPETGGKNVSNKGNETSTP